MQKIFWLIKGMGLGGSEMLLAQSVPHLDRSRFQYELGYFLPGKKALVPAFEAAGVPTFCLAMRGVHDVFLPLRLARLLRERRVDLLHVHLPFSGVVGRLAGRMAGVRRIMYTEHLPVHEYHPLTAYANLLTYPLNDLVTTVSEEVRRSVDGRLPPDRLVTVYNGVDFSRLQETAAGPSARTELGIPEGALVVGTVGNLREQKDHEALLEAARRVVASCSSCRFVVVGAGSEEREAHLKEHARRLGLEGRVIFTGFRDDAPRLMAAFDVFMLSSQYEGLPVSLLEAMTLGKPAVATQVGGIPEVLSDGVEGFLVPPKRPDLLAERLLQLLTSEDLRKTMGQNAKERAAAFDIRQMVRTMEGLYDQLLRP